MLRCKSTLGREYTKARLKSLRTIILQVKTSMITCRAEGNLTVVHHELMALSIDAVAQ